MKKIALIYLSLFFIVIQAKTQTGSWSYLTNAKEVYSVWPFGDSIICNTNAGILKVDTSGNGFRMLPFSGSYGSVVADSAGTIWFSSNIGLDSYDGTTHTNYNTGNSGIPSNDIRQLDYSSGKLWISSIGISSFDGVIWNNYNSGNSAIPSDFVNDFAFGPDGKLWVATDNGIGSFDGSSWVVFDTSNSPLLIPWVSAIAVDDSNHVWIATEDWTMAGSFAANILMYDGVQWNNFPSALYPGSNVRSIACDRNGRVYFGTRTSYSNGWFAAGLVLYEQGNWISINTIDEINQLTADSYGNVYASTNDDYLYKFDGSAYLRYDLFNSSISSNEITGIDISVTGKKYVTSINHTFNWTEQYLDYFDGNNWKHCGSVEGNTNFISFINDSVAWAGVDYQLFELRDSIMELLLVDTTGLGGSYNAIATDTNGHIWLATSNGLGVFDGTSWTVYNSGNSGLPNDGVYSVAVDPMNNIWVGTDTAIAVFDHTSWTVYSNSNSPLPAGTAFPMCTDGNGTFWAGINGYFTGVPGGIVQFSAINGTASNWIIYDTLNSQLPDNVINALEFSDGKLWIGTNKGAASMDTVMTVYVNTYLGLLNNRVRSISTNVSGKIYFGTDRFISILEQDSIITAVRESVTVLGEMFIYPNPSNGNFMMDLGDNNSGSVMIEVVDVTGKRVFERESSNQKLIEIEINSPPGIYFLYVTGERMMKGKIIVE